MLGALLNGNGFSPVHASTAAEGLARLEEEEPDVILLDLMLPDRSGLELLPELKQRAPYVPVVIITAYSSIESAIEAMRAGAFHYVPKPFKNAEVLHLVRRAMEQRRLLTENVRLRNQLAGYDEIIGRSRRMHEVFELLHRIGPARSNVLITGEPGTGKELLARAIHRRSPRMEGPFVSLRAGAVPPGQMASTLFGHVKGAFPGAVGGQRGLLEAAHGGTFFLDEIGTLSQDVQASLVRVLQDREVYRLGSDEPRHADVRLIAACAQDLWEQVEQGRFREDLYYRLSVITIELPPLRERVEDIPLLAQRFLKRYAAENERRIEAFTPRAVDALCAYPWPGNVRELENAVERAVVMCRRDVIDLDELPEPVRKGMVRMAPATILPSEGLDFRKAVEEYQRRLIREALKRTGGVQRQAARLLRMSPTTFNEKVHRLGLAGEGE
ncbi:MAG TPA: sigma-54-dependent Fis family transcriptional regulator [Acidobacteria bacterium]|nr:sigma-54-dependent Fis family transcriptional regulator [Acidobacteriota bacterium]